jgi:predicted RNA-binding Zn-ribbon protein involved in translation (DUF1610 family)
MSELYSNEELDILTFKLILDLNNNWEEYKKNDKYKVRDVEIKEVEKMLGCIDIEKGYTSYICQACGEIIYIPHSCKRRMDSIPYIDYGIIRKKWQYAILTAVRKAMPRNNELNKTRIIHDALKSNALHG